MRVRAACVGAGLSVVRVSADCASATQGEAGNRVERGFRGEFRLRVFVVANQAVVLSRVMDVAAS